MAREFESALPVGGFVVRLRSGFDKASFPSACSDILKEAVRTELQQLFAKVCELSAPMSAPGLVK